MNTNLMKRRATWIGVALLIVAGAVALGSRHPIAWAADAPAAATATPAAGNDTPATATPARVGSATPAAAPVQATTAPVQQQDVPIYRSGIGTVTAAATVTVRTRIDGQLEKVGFIEGQDVKAGQLLARLDPRTLQAQLAQARAQQARDQAQLANARLDLQRYTRLLADDASTPQQVDTQKALVAQLEAAVQTDAAQVDYAQVQLGFTTITAPIGGRVGARLVDAGNIVHATDASGLVVINQVDPITVLFTLPEDAIPAINQVLDARGAAPVVEAYPREGNTLLGRGRLVLLNNQIDTATGTVQLKAAFANPQHRLWPGQFVNVRLMLGVREKALTVPAPAVQRGQDGTYAYVLDADGQTVLGKPITVARIQDGLAVVDAGLAAGQRVVVDGQYKLKPGARIVEAQRRQAAAETPPTR